MKTIILTALTAILCTLSLSARAIPITWDFVGASASGGTITGSFVFDADTSLFSGVSVMTADGSLPTATYSYANPAFADARALDFTSNSGPDFTGGQDLYIPLLAQMTNTGGSIALGTVQTGICIDPTCSDFIAGTDTFENVPEGSIVSRVKSVPEPGTLVLLSFGLAGIGFALKKKETQDFSFNHPPRAP